MREAPVTEVVLKMHAAAIPPDEAGLIELKTLTDALGVEGAAIALRKRHAGSGADVLSVI
ncbi:MULTISPECIES: hypothetical protein [Brevundimonas]|jgi:hypothetical protein|uniref:hypothetical protein n=1 Tax=Brevundimonas TaxID=41275 RepID=UPI001747F481|nr:hypothetical protein [Brevundimonas aurantiaca]